VSWGDDNTERRIVPLPTDPIDPIVVRALQTARKPPPDLDDAWDESAYDGTDRKACRRCGREVPVPTRPGTVRVFCSRSCSVLASRDRCDARKANAPEAVGDEAVGGVVERPTDGGSRRDVQV